ncbi:MAG TPA: LON peptidase substrate-binding domain-containing protein [Polyangia bacterium]|jgi:ATP-dependent Lon protease
MEDEIEIGGELVVLPLRNAVMFPGSLIPLEIGRARSVVAVERATAAAGVLALVAQKDQADDSPDMPLFDVGCAARILKVMKLAPDKLVAIVQGLRRIRVLGVDRTGPCFVARVETIAEPAGFDDEVALGKAETLRASARRFVEATPDLPREAFALLDAMKHPGQLADVVFSTFDLASVEAKQRALETIALVPRLDLALELVRRHLQP